MAKSRARKTREKRVREGRIDPAINRGIYALADLSTRRSKTKKETMYQNKYGELSSMDRNQTDESSFYFVSFYIRGCQDFSTMPLQLPLCFRLLLSQKLQIRHPHQLQLPMRHFPY